MNTRVLIGPEKGNAFILDAFEKGNYALVPAEERATVALALLGMTHSAEAIGKALAAVIAQVDKAEESEATFYTGLTEYEPYALVCDLARALGVDPHP